MRFEKVSYERVSDKFTRDAYNKIKLPKRSTKYSAGYDFFNPYPFKINLEPKGKIFITTGIKVKLDKDKVLKIYPRSSLGIRGLVLINSTGIIDSDYYNNPDNEGEIIMPLINTGKETIKIDVGMKIAQGVICQYFTVDNEDETETRTGGFGSTDKTKKNVNNTDIDYYDIIKSIIDRMNYDVNLDTEDRYKVMRDITNYFIGRI